MVYVLIILNFINNFKEILQELNKNRTEILQKLYRNCTEIKQKLNRNLTEIEQRLYRNLTEIEHVLWVENFYYNEPFGLGPKISPCLTPSIDKSRKSFN